MQQSGALQFFCVQAVGIMTEEGFQHVYRRYVGSKPGSYLATAEKVVGYTWVAFFVVWTSPVWVYPVVLDMKKEEALLGFDAFKPILFGRK